MTHRLRARTMIPPNKSPVPKVTGISIFANFISPWPGISETHDKSSHSPQLSIYRPKKISQVRQREPFRTPSLLGIAPIFKLFLVRPRVRWNLLAAWFVASAITLFPRSPEHSAAAASFAHSTHPRDWNTAHTRSAASSLVRPVKSNTTLSTSSPVLGFRCLIIVCRSLNAAGPPVPIWISSPSRP